MTAARIGGALGALLLATAPAAAQAPAAPAGTPAPASYATPAAASPWSFYISPYAWLAGLSGSSSLPQRGRDYDADWGNNALSDLKFAAMLSFEARYGRFSLILDGMVLEMEQGITTPRGTLFNGGNGQLTGGGASLAGLVRVVEDPAFNLDLGTGMRGWWLDTKFTLNPGLAAGRTASASANILTPFVALRAQVRLTDSFSLTAYGDIGGYAEGMDLTWQALATLDWRATDNLTARVGYRHIAMDFSRSNLALDIALSGPILGITYRF